MRAVLFDFNGTLFDDTRFHLAAWRRYIRERFDIELSEAQVRAQFIGPNNHTIFQNFFGERYSASEVDAFCLEKERVYREVVRSDPANLRLMEGAPEMLDMLTARGVPFALATASQLDNVRFYLDDLGLRRWFTMERIVYDTGALASKPDPAFYLEAARRLKVDPADCLICEDTLAGIEAARRAGAGRIVAIDRTVPREKLLAEPGIFAVAHDFTNFERFI